MTLDRLYQALVVGDLLLADLDDLVALFDAGFLGGAPLADRTYHSAFGSLTQHHSDYRAVSSPLLCTLHTNEGIADQRE